MGQYADGTYAYKHFPDFTDPLDYLTLIIIVLTLIGFLVVFGMQLRYFRWDARYIQALIGVLFSCIAFTVLKLLYLFTDSPPIINALYVVFGCVSVLLSFLVDAELFKKFVPMSKSIQEHHISRLQHFGCTSMYIRLFYVGKPFPLWLTIWYTVGYSGSLLITQIIEFCQVICIALLCRQLVVDRRRFNGQLATNISIQSINQEERRQEEREQDHGLIRIFVTLSLMILLQGCGGILTIYDFLASLESVNYQVIGNTLTVMNPILSYAVFSGLQRVTIMRHRSSRSTTRKEHK
ncbi:hypothetical protein EDD86DRAFT_245084 [Gorgonomyces haynaldii]|nr:hypothetical protein EDD86DRAFT_245084 [Gorgonomyces haynaldii]